MLVRIIAVIATLFIGLIAGFFYAWICSTMWGLDATKPDVAITAMNAMNASVRNGVFFPIFFLTPALLLIAAIVTWKNTKASSTLFAFAAMVYVFGGIVPTAMVNVPINEALASMVIPAKLEDASAVWRAYSERWQFWNILRTVFSILAFVLAMVGLMKLPLDTGA